MSNPVTTAVRHTLARLAAATPLAGVPVWEGAAPEHATYPMVLAQIYGDAADVGGTAGFRAATVVTMSVRVVVKDGDLGAAEPLADAVDAALHHSGPAGYTSGTVASCVRSAQTSMTEVAGGHTYRYLGGLYELVCY